MTALQYILSLRPALPMSAEKPGGKDKPCSAASNSEVRRWISDGTVLFNHEKCKPEEEIDFPIHSLVFFPRSKRRTTLV